MPNPWKVLYKDERRQNRQLKRRLEAAKADAHADREMWSKTVANLSEARDAAREQLFDIAIAAGLVSSKEEAKRRIRYYSESYLGTIAPAVRELYERVYRNGSPPLGDRLERKWEMTEEEAEALCMHIDQALSEIHTITILGDGEQRVEGAGLTFGETIALAVAAFVVKTVNRMAAEVPAAWKQEMSEALVRAQKAEARAARLAKVVTDG